MHPSVVRRTGIICVAALAVLCEDGCHRATNAAPGAAAAPNDVMASRGIITAAQIAEGHFNTAMDAVEALRANWLHKRGADSFNNPGEIQVYLDNVRLGGVETLRGIQVNPIVSIRFIPALEATARWGLDHGHGVIFVSTRD